MEKLTLEHLTPYLPYGLKVRYEGLIVDDYTLNLKNIEHTIRIPNRKPVFRPSTDLNKNVIDYIWLEVLVVDNAYYDYLIFIEHCENGRFHLLPSIVYNFLLSEHFDVFGLIDKGLAIDINTL